MNAALLEYELKKKGMKKEELCEALGMSRSAFYRKMNGISEFTLSEIQNIVSTLDLESPVPIFFSDEVS